MTLGRTPLLMAAALAALSAAAPAGGAAPEYAVKAAYIAKFAPFVEWPQGSGPFRVCVAGDDPFDGALEKAAAGQSVGGRPMQVKKLARVQRGSGCQVVYIAGNSPQAAAEAVRAVAGEPVLTVTDENRGYGVKGVIHFVVRDKRVRFEIDDQAAKQNGLSVSSKLLSLAVAVRPRS